MGGKGRHLPAGVGPGRAVGQHPDTQAEVGPAVGAGEQPAVAGEAPARLLVPQQDVGDGDGVGDVGAQGEAPQHPLGVDQAGGLGHPAGGPVGADHEIGGERLPGGELEAGQRPAGAGHRVLGPGGEGLGPGGRRRVVKQGVEAGAGHGQGPPRIGEARRAGQVDPPAAGADDDHVVDHPGPGQGDVQVLQEAHPPGTDQVTAGLVAREGGLVDQRHPGPAAGQGQGGHAAGRAGADHQDIELQHAGNFKTPDLSRVTSVDRALTVRVGRPAPGRGCGR